MNEKKLTISYFEYKSVEELPTDDQQLLVEAERIAEHSYSPYSEFRVGAALLLENGEIIAGANQENAAYPSGLCAERVALFYANSQYPDVAVKKIAIVAYNKQGLLPDAVPPCGGCRQVMSETEQRFNKPMEILLKGKSNILRLSSMDSLLPLSFKKEYL